MPVTKNYPNVGIDPFIFVPTIGVQDQYIPVILANVRQCQILQMSEYELQNVEVHLHPQILSHLLINRVVIID